MKPFNAWTEGIWHYLPSILIGAGGLWAALSHHRTGWAVGAGFLLLLGIFALFFFRDPPRVISAKDNELVSPADGTIVGIEDLATSPHYDGPCRRVSIFLSVFNVHINRAPFDGTVRDIRYRPGEFKNAMKAETTDCNEANAVWIDTPKGLITVRQISGLIARRIVCRVKAGDAVTRGQKFGMIKFGSRTELYLPPGTEVRVQLKDSVKAGSTVVAQFK